MSTTPGDRYPRVAPAVFAVLVVAVFFGTIGVAAATGAWQTTGRSTGAGQPGSPQGDSATSVKGWMAVGDVAVAWDVPLAELLAAFDLPPDTSPSTPLKELESDAFTVKALRDWLVAQGAGTDTTSP